MIDGIRKNYKFLPVTPQSSVEEAGYDAAWVPLHEDIMDLQPTKQISFSNFLQD